MVRYTGIKALPDPEIVPNPVILDSSSIIRAFETRDNFINSFRSNKRDKSGMKRYLKRCMRRKNKSCEILETILNGRLRKEVVIPSDVITEVNGVVSSSNDYNLKSYDSWKKGFFETKNYVVNPEHICKTNLFKNSKLYQILVDCNKDLSKKSKGEIAVIYTAWNFGKQGYNPENYTNRYSSISIVSEDYSYFDSNLQNKLTAEFFRNFKLKSSQFKIYDIEFLYTTLKMMK